MQAQTRVGEFNIIPLAEGPVRGACFGNAAKDGARRFDARQEGRLVIEDDEEDSRNYLVVCNSEEQFSIWPSHKPIPRGWRSVGKDARKAECLRYIESVWTDMRPRSLREHIKATESLRDNSESTES